MERRTANLVWAAMAVAILAVAVPALGWQFGLGGGGNAAAKAPVGRWTAYLAPESACPGGTDSSRPQAAQVRTMVCLVNWARARAGLSAPVEVAVLGDSARLKAQDIIACADFRHEACGRDPSAVFDDVAYGSDSAERRIGENLAWGAGLAASPLHVLNGWLNSPPHRALLFRPDWAEQGIAVVPAPGFEGYPEAEIWVSHFGTRL